MNNMQVISIDDGVVKINGSPTEKGDTIEIFISKEVLRKYQVTIAHDVDFHPYASGFDEISVNALVDKQKEGAREAEHIWSEKYGAKDE
jgi:hypothetical protein